MAKLKDGASIVTKEQIEAWKKQHGVVHQIDVEVSKEGDVATCYIRKPNRNEMAYIISLQNQSKILESKEFLLNNCWLGGDERCKTVEEIAMAAAIQAGTTVEFLAAEVKKL